MGVFVRGKKLYLRLKATDGRWKQIRTGLTDDERGRGEAAKQLRDFERQVKAHVSALGTTEHAITVRTYGDQWLDKRKTTTIGDDRARMRLHVYPKIGEMPLADVRPRHLRDLVIGLRDAGELAPATIRNVSGLLHTMFKSAVIEEVIAANPVQFDRGVLPKKVDKDPTWRHQAIYTRGEIESLISDEHVLADRRVLYALKSLAALRHTEAATLTWSQYDQVAMPLGAINLGVTKNGVPRRMPVHPTLAKLLAEWKLSGWEALTGRKPKPDDLIVPTRNLTARDAGESQRQLIADLELLELRTSAGARQHRRGHDMRRTFITLARTDGAAKDILRWVTHGPTPKEMMDLYSSFDWATLCAEVAKLKIERLMGQLIELPIAVGSVAGSLQVTEVLTMTTEKERPRRDSNPNFSDRKPTTIRGPAILFAGYGRGESRSL